MANSQLSGLYRLPIAERIALLREQGWLSDEQAIALQSGRSLLTPSRADSMIENVLGVFGLPFAVATNFVCNQRDCLVPLAVEEPSIVAALSSAAALARNTGGFQAECAESLLVGQIHLLDIADMDAATDALADAEDELVALADASQPRLAKRGGGVRSLEYRRLHLDDGTAVLAVHVAVDTCDAMGANLVNTLCETLAPRMAEITSGVVALRILSNLTDRSLVTARVRFRSDDLATSDMSGDTVRDAIVRANDIANADVYRAATHNKGIMNGIDPLAIATGNDWRAIEAGVHAYAASDGQYRALTQWQVADDGALLGAIRLPLKVGIVGGTLESNTAASIGLALTGAGTATQLAELMAAVGLAQNFAAIRALVTRGIQHGHMRLHARSLAVAAGADERDVENVVEQMVASGEIKDWKAREIVAARTEQPMPADAASAAGKVILLGEHAVVYGAHALAVPIPDAVRAVASSRDDATTLSVPEWRWQQRIDSNDTSAPAAIIARILSELDCTERHFAIKVSSRLPLGKGLGSSAAFAVAVTRAIAQTIGAKIDDERVNDIAYLCETLTHGTPSGVDNTLSCYGKALLYQRDTAAEFTTLDLSSRPPLVIGIADGTGSTSELVDGVRVRRAAATAQYDALFQQIGELSLAGHSALQRGDYTALGQLMNICQGLLNALGVSTAELESMIEIARDNGAVGAKLTGAGGGGAIVALCPGTTQAVHGALQAAGFATLALEGSDT